LILQNLMFSLPQEASLYESIGENLNARILKSLICFAITSGFSPLAILVISQTIMSSLFLVSFPTAARNYPSWEKAKVLRALTKVEIMATHLPVLYSQILIIGFFPSWPEAIRVPFSLIAMQQIA
jgi:hypothetical protein